MKYKKILIFLSILINSVCTQNIFFNIHDVLDKEIFIYDGWDGQSFKIVLEHENYYLYRNFFTDDRIIGTIKYGVRSQSELFIIFKGIISKTENFEAPSLYDRTNEVFEISVLYNRMRIFLNGIEIKVKYIK